MGIRLEKACIPTIGNLQELAAVFFPDIVEMDFYGSLGPSEHQIRTPEHGVFL
jgi:hypothetical protein